MFAIKQRSSLLKIKGLGTKIQSFRVLKITILQALSSLRHQDVSIISSIILFLETYKKIQFIYLFNKTFQHQLSLNCKSIAILVSGQQTYRRGPSLLRSDFQGRSNRPPVAVQPVPQTGWGSTSPIYGLSRPSSSQHNPDFFSLPFSLALSLALVNSCLIFCTFSFPLRRFLKSAFNALFVFSPCGMQSLCRSCRRKKSEKDGPKRLEKMMSLHHQFLN